MNFCNRACSTIFTRLRISWRIARPLAMNPSPTNSQHPVRSVASDNVVPAAHVTTFSVAFFCMGFSVFVHVLHTHTHTVRSGARDFRNGGVALGYLWESNAFELNAWHIVSSGCAGSIQSGFVTNKHNFSRLYWNVEIEHVIGWNVMQKPECGHIFHYQQVSVISRVLLSNFNN